MKENKVIIITMILNLIVAIIKFTSGVIFSFSTLIGDSIQSFIDFITDITSLIANRIGKRRANKTYPFGYGQVYYLANIFTGALLFLIGIFILYQFFFFTGKLKPNLTLFILIIIVLAIKLIVVKLLNHYGKKFKSELMIEASRESNTDFISTCVVLIILILSVLEQSISININVDKIGSLGMAIYVFYISIIMIIGNVRGILANDEENNEMKKEIINELNIFKELDIKNVRIIKMSTYYSVFIKVKVKDNLTIKEYLLIQKRIKAHLKSKNKVIRFIDVEPV
ncbi:MAG: cation diffusion facilitator family transporter [Clostridia bacterium]|nr:cation diffusion facilitator family transporter [Clostridia bacterium]